MVLLSSLFYVLMCICILIENAKKVMHNTVEELRAEVVHQKATRRGMNGAQKEARRKHELIMEARRQFYAFQITNMYFVQMVCGVIGNRWAGQPQGVISISEEDS